MLDIPSIGHLDISKLCMETLQQAEQELQLASRSGCTCGAHRTRENSEQSGVCRRAPAHHISNCISSSEADPTYQHLHSSADYQLKMLFILAPVERHFDIGEAKLQNITSSIMLPTMRFRSFVAHCTRILQQPKCLERLGRMKRALAR